MKFILISAALAVLLCFAPASVSAQGKTCNLKEIDMCVTNWYYDQSGIPSNEKVMRKACSSSRTLVKCLHTYFDRCSSPAVRETLKLFLAAIVNPFLEVCAKPVGDEARTEMYHYAKCLNGNAKKIQVCGEENKNVIFYLLDSHYLNRVPIVCCNAKLASDCTYKKTVELCGQDHADWQKKYYSAMDIIRDICHQFNPYNESCKDFLVPENWVSKEDPKAPLSRMINAFF
ncbi:hypothetical protein TYRP_003765 [Tyrophagus putrescentiae]|nr:hypothetical protein TYRP_003765 [Tyrophagus putrescentiae]